MRRKISLPLNSRFSALFFASLAIGIANSPVRIAATNAVGVSQGKLSAQPSGGVGYEMPIVVSPGTAGIQPKLAFQYSSGGRNGALGMGWSIGGISAITRAPQTLAQDGAIHGVDVTLADRYSMDGQRLIAISGPDGYAGTEYRTEINSFTKVVSNGQYGAGPLTFTAWTKSGLIYTFGGSGGASFVPSGKSTILTWLLSKVQDQAGNYMTFQYSSEGNLTSVNYTMNDSAGLGGYASVVFTYDTSRPDPASGYVAGSSISMTQRLTRVQSFYGTQIVRQYDLAYNVSPTTGKSRLASITEGTGTQTYPPTQFTWDNNTNTQALMPSLAASATKDNTAWAQGDFDTDGLVDLVRMRDGVIKVYNISGGQLVEAGSFTSSQSFDSTKDTWLQGDFSGDGKLDIIRVHAEGNTAGNAVAFTTFTNTGLNGSGNAFSQSNATINGTSPPWYVSRPYLAMDVNGDGKLDIVCINGVDPQSGNSQDTKIWAYINNGNATFTGSVWTYTSVDTTARTAPGSDKCAQLDRWLVGDFNGDGLPDLAKVWENNGKNTVRIYLNQNGSWVAANWIFKSGTFYENNDNTQPVAYLWVTGDFNGDGLADLVRIPKATNVDGANTADAFLSTGSVSSMFAGPQQWLSLIVGEQAKIQAGDYNADGRSDLVVLKDHVKGSNTSAGSITAQAPPGGTPGLPVDPNGLTAFLDDPVTAALIAMEENESASTLSTNPTHRVPITNYPGQGEVETGWGTASDTATSTTTSASQYTYTTTRGIYLSNGSAFYQSTLGDDAQSEVTSYSVPQFGRWYTADFNGDGKEDLVRKFSVTDSSGQRYTYFNAYLSASGFQDLMRAVTDGMGSTTSVDYEPLTGVNGIPVFRKSNDAVPPAIDLIEPMPVVASITYDNGLGSPGSSNYSVSYFYEGLKADPQRGMLGFRSVEAVDNRPLDGQASNVRLRTKSWLKQGFPFTGMAERAIGYLGDSNITNTKSFGDSSGLLSLTISSCAAGPTENNNTRIYFPYAQDSHAYSWDLNGTATNDTETIVQQIDAYGNTGTSVVKTKDIPSSNYFVKTTTSNYNVSTSNWRIGQVTTSSVLSQAPGQPNITRTSGFSYNASNGEVGSETIEPGGASSMQTAYTFDAFGNTKVATTTGNDIATRTTETDYDTRGRFVATTINALNQTEAKLYDERFGGVASVTGPNNLTDTASYDDFSRKTLSTRADGTNTRTSYEWVAGNSDSHLNPPANAVYLVRVTPDDGPQGITYFDRLGREMRKETIAGNGKTEFADTTYDYRGRKSTVTKPYFKGDSAIVAVSYYDALDRVTLLQVPSVDDTGASVMTSTTSAYNGLVTTATNPKGQSTTTTKDAAGHLRQVVDALNGTIAYTYDSLGELTQTVDSAGNTTSIAYDTRGRKISVNDPDLGFWSYTYYSTGELKTQTDAKNQTVSFQYDKLGRMTRRDDPTTDYTVWTYDTAPGKGIGKLASVQFTPHNGSTLAPYSNSISYDNLGRPSSQSTSIERTTYTTSTSYDLYSRPQILTYPNGFQVKDVYNSYGYLAVIQSPDNAYTYWNAQGYDADGHITKEAYQNGVVTSRTYIPENGLLKTIVAGYQGGSAVQNLEYHFDVLGNLKSRKDSNQTIQGSTLRETFNYDSLNRLINWQATGQAQQNVSYDTIGTGAASLGNIKHKDGVGDYTYPAAGAAHPHAVLSAGNSGTATYDANGNMQSGFNRSTTWTWFNQPQQITGYSAVAYFEYDPDHQRVWQHASTNGGIVDTTYVGGFYEKVDDANTTKSKCYINAPTGRVAIYTQTYDKHTFGNTYDTKYLHKDHLGSVDVITDATGAVLERDSFDAWGFRRTTDWQSQKPIGSTSIVSRGFTDHEELDGLGLVNMNGRIYDPGIGRFLSADPFVQAPMVTQNFNRYSYVVNNPLSFSDPTGFNIFGNFFNWMNQHLGSTGTQIVIAVAAIAVGVVTAGIATAGYAALIGVEAAALQGTLAGAIVGGAGFGFGAGFTGSLLSGASIGQAFQAGLIGGAIGAVSGAAAFELGGLPGAGDMFSLGHLEQSVGEAVIGGVTGEIQGGNWQAGALAGGLSAALAPEINLIGGGARGQHYEYEAMRVAASAAVGGTAAELGGGKFANGAVTAAFMRLYNEEVHWNYQKQILKAWRYTGTLKQIEGNSYAGGECGNGVEYLCSLDGESMPSSWHWIKGPGIVNNYDIPQFAAVATFDENGKYPNTALGEGYRGNHTALYLNQDKNYVYIVGQGGGQPMEVWALPKYTPLPPMIFRPGIDTHWMIKNGSAYAYNLILTR